MLIRVVRKQQRSRMCLVCGPRDASGRAVIIGHADEPDAVELPEATARAQEDSNG